MIEEKVLIARFYYSKERLEWFECLYALDVSRLFRNILVFLLNFIR